MAVVWCKCGCPEVAEIFGWRFGGSVFDRKLRSGLSKSFILILRRDFVNFLYRIRKPVSLILDKRPGKSYIFWIREPESLIILDERTGNSYLG